MEINVFLVNTAIMPIKWEGIRLLNIFVLNVVVTFKNRHHIRKSYPSLYKRCHKAKIKNLYFRFMIKQQYQIYRYIKRIEINHFFFENLLKKDRGHFRI